MSEKIKRISSKYEIEKFGQVFGLYSNCNPKTYIYRNGLVEMYV